MTDTPSTEALTQRALERQGVRVRKYDGEEWVSLHDWAESCARQEAADTSGLRDRVIEDAVEWVAAHDALSLDNPTGPPDHELLERYSEACNNLLAIVSQNRAALAQEAPERPLDVAVLGAAWLNLWGGSHESPPNDLVLIALHGMMEGLVAEYARLARSEEPT